MLRVGRIKSIMRNSINKEKGVSSKENVKRKILVITKHTLNYRGRYERE